MSNLTPVPQTMDRDRNFFERDLLDRFLRYVTYHTTSDPHIDSTPSTEHQWDLARLLERELKELGLNDVSLDDHCYLFARVPATAGGAPIGLMAHIDTAPDLTGENVRPLMHENYDGGVIQLGDSEFRLDPDEYPTMLQYTGDTVITTDGTTLLGADDKAGVAEIVTAIRYLLEHPEIPRPPIEVIFTPDEETGRGMDHFPQDRLESEFCVTVDGTAEGSIEAECFTAFKCTVSFTGYVIHPGQARGKLANAAAMASQFVSLLPRSESPEATDELYGFYCPIEISGGLASATATVIVRDFDMATAERRLAYLESAARTVEGAFPGGAVSIQTHRQYVNMADYIAPHPQLLDRMTTAVRQTGIEPTMHRIRGGTDGARLSERGIPTPNLFTGGQNLHGRYEWIAVSAMVRASKTLVNLVQLYAESSSA